MKHVQHQHFAFVSNLDVFESRYLDKMIITQKSDKLINSTADQTRKIIRISKTPERNDSDIN